MAQQPPKRPPTPLPIPPSKPTRNVPAVVVEEKTPVDMPMEALIERRTRQTKENVDSTLISVNQLRGELRTYVERDEREHQDLKRDMGQKYDELNGKISQLQLAQATTDSKVDESATQIANANGKLDILVGVVQSQHQIMVHREKVTIEREATQEKIQLEDRADEKKFKRQKWLKIIGAVGGGVTLLFTALAALLGKC